MKTKLTVSWLLLISMSGVINAQINIDGYSINPKLGAYNWIGENIGLARGCEINALSKKKHLFDGLL